MGVEAAALDEVRFNVVSKLNLDELGLKADASLPLSEESSSLPSELDEDELEAEDELFDDDDDSGTPDLPFFRFSFLFFLLTLAFLLGGGDSSSSSALSWLASALTRLSTAIFL